MLDDKSKKPVGAMRFLRGRARQCQPRTSAHVRRARRARRARPRKSVHSHRALWRIDGRFGAYAGADSVRGFQGIRRITYLYVSYTPTKWL